MTTNHQNNLWVDEDSYKLSTFDWIHNRAHQKREWLRSAQSHYTNQKNIEEWRLYRLIAELMQFPVVLKVKKESSKSYIENLMFIGNNAVVKLQYTKKASPLKNTDSFDTYLYPSYKYTVFEKNENTWKLKYSSSQEAYLSNDQWKTLYSWIQEVATESLPLKAYDVMQMVVESEFSSEHNHIPVILLRACIEHLDGQHDHDCQRYVQMRGMLQLKKVHQHAQELLHLRNHAIMEPIEMDQLLDLKESYVGK